MADTSVLPSGTFGLGVYRQSETLPCLPYLPALQEVAAVWAGRPSLAMALCSSPLWSGPDNVVCAYCIYYAGLSIPISVTLSQIYCKCLDISVNLKNLRVYVGTTRKRESI